MREEAKPAGTRWTRKGAAERREEILLAAMRLFARDGFERTTTKAIAQEAGISEGTIYKYFTSKTDVLFSAVSPAILSPLTDIFDRLATADDAQVIRAVIADRFALWDQWQDIIRVIFSEALHNPELTKAFHTSVSGPAMQLLERYLTRRVQEGAFRPMHVSIVARAMIGHMIAMFLLWDGPLGGEYMAVTREERVDELTRLLLYGMRTVPSEVAP